MRGRLYLPILAAGAGILAGCAGMNGPTLAERLALADALYAQGQTAIMQEDGKKADYGAAAAYYEKAARTGSAQAAYALAALYRDGLIAEKTSEAAKEKAFFWMQDAAVGGWPQAQYETAVFLHEGKGVTPDREKAVYWLHQAGANGNVLAQRFLGRLYYRGGKGEGTTSVSRDRRQSAAWYLKAAQNGDAESQAVIARMYLTGDGVEKDYTQAVRWSNSAADKGYLSVAHDVSALYAGLAGQEQAARSMSVYAGEYGKGSAEAGFKLARLYYYALKPYGNARKAVDLFRNTEDKAPASAMMLGVAYEEGRGTRRDEGKAVAQYKKAIAAGLAEAHAHLGECYRSGRGVTKSMAQAAASFERGASAGNSLCARLLAELYMQGAGVAKDAAKARALMEYAAQAGDHKAMYLYALMLENESDSQNSGDVRAWLVKAAEYASGDSPHIRLESDIAVRAKAKGALRRMR